MRARSQCPCRRSSRRVATRSDFMRRERVFVRVSLTVVVVVVVVLWARFRAWTAWIASVLSTRPFTSGPRLSLGPQ